MQYIVCTNFSIALNELAGGEQTVCEPITTAMKKTALFLGSSHSLRLSSPNSQFDQSNRLQWQRTVGGLEKFDIRLLKASETGNRGYNDAIEGIQVRFPGVRVERHDVFPVPEIISVGNELKAPPLSPPSSDSREAIVRAFLKREQSLFGLNEDQIETLVKTADNTNPAGNLST